MSVAFVREESADAAREVSLPLRAISAYPNLVTSSGLRALEHALADGQRALEAAQYSGRHERRRALELAARDVRYFAERVASAIPQAKPADTVLVAFGSKVTICATTVAARRSVSLERMRRIPAADPSPMCSPLAVGSSERTPVRPWRWTGARLRLSRSNRMFAAEAETRSTPMAVD